MFVDEERKGLPLIVEVFDQVNQESSGALSLTYCTNFISLSLKRTEVPVSRGKKNWLLDQICPFSGKQTTSFRRLQTAA